MKKPESSSAKSDQASNQTKDEQSNQTTIEIDVAYFNGSSEDNSPRLRKSCVHDRHGRRIIFRIKK